MDWLPEVAFFCFVFIVLLNSTAVLSWRDVGGYTQNVLWFPALVAFGLFIPPANIMIFFLGGPVSLVWGALIMVDLYRCRESRMRFLHGFNLSFVVIMAVVYLDLYLDPPLFNIAH